MYQISSSCHGRSTQHPNRPLISARTPGPELKPTGAEAHRGSKHSEGPRDPVHTSSFEVVSRRTLCVGDIAPLDPARTSKWSFRHQDPSYTLEMSRVTLTPTYFEVAFRPFVYRGPIYHTDGSLETATLSPLRTSKWSFIYRNTWCTQTRGWRVGDCPSPLRTSKWPFIYRDTCCTRVVGDRDPLTSHVLRIGQPHYAAHECIFHLNCRGSCLATTLQEKSMLYESPPTKLVS